MLLGILVVATEGPHQVVVVVFHLKLLEFEILLFGTPAVVHFYLCLCKLVYMFSTEFLYVKQLSSVFKDLHYL